MKIAVTGGSGFLGGRLIPLLVENGYQVTALARSAVAAQKVANLGAQPVDGDLDVEAHPSLKVFFQSSRTLVNLASLGFGHAPTIVRAATEAGVERAIFVSTTAIFTTLNAVSRRTRVEAEKSIADSKLNWTIIRPTMIYGTPADRNMARLLTVLDRVPLVPLPGGGHRLQQPVHVDDLARAIMNSVNQAKAIHRSYDLAGPTPLSLRQVVHEAADAIGRKVIVFPVPLRVVTLAVGLQEKALKQPRLRVEQILRLGEDKIFDISDAVADLGFAPRSFPEGILQEAEMMGLRR